MADRTEVARKNLEKGRRKRQRKLARERKRKEAERQAQLERVAGPAPQQKERGPWTYKDVSYGTLQGCIIAVLAHHGETEQAQVIGAWASMWTQEVE